MTEGSTDAHPMKRKDKRTRMPDDDVNKESKRQRTKEKKFDQVHTAIKRLMFAVDGGSRPEDLVRLTGSNPEVVEINEPKCVEYLNKIHDQIVELKQNSIKKRKANWSGLPTELLESILKKLIPSEFDILGFRDIRYFKAVCHSWRTAAISCSSYVPLPRTPCLLLHENNSSLFDPIGKKVHQIRNICDFFPRATCVGSSYGWIVMFYEDEDSKESMAHLFNPISRASIPIPGTQTLQDYSLANKISKAIVSSNPSSNKNFFVVVEYKGNLAYYKLGDGDKSWRKLGDNNRHKYIMFHNDQLIALSRGLTEIWNFKEYPPRRPRRIEDSPTDGRVEDSYLVESLTGDILRVGKSVKERGMDGTSQFSVKKLNLAESKWENVQSLGDQSLYLFREHVMSLPNPCFLGCEKNSIYFATTKVEEYRIYNLDEGKVIRKESFSENVQLNACCKPFWIVPNPW
ncbi:putative F-box protein At1g65770 [Rosa rugosa]|uniref:putative F-box protein At1g65770 n=1 Tax=Rosa rugosa TaxID=74645 RepID=UPI002B417B01|nr:putative F-box protein At1g65770 [Rosa rugosa]